MSQSSIPCSRTPNYGVWAVKMKVLLRSFGLWPTLEGTAEFDQGRDDGALAVLSQSVPDSVMMTVAHRETAHDA